MQLWKQEEWEGEKKEQEEGDTKEKNTEGVPEGEESWQKTGNGKNKADMHLQAQEDICGIPQREGQVQEAWVQPYNLQEDGKLKDPEAVN